jgi:hypothetical protein
MQEKTMIRVPSQRLAAAAALFVALASLPALAQMPPPAPAVPLPAEVAACYCLRQSMDAAQADMTAKNAALDAARADVQRLDAQLSAERARMNVNDEQHVARFRAQLQERDAAFARSTGEALAADQSAIARYNQVVADYNNQCAGRPLPPPPPGPLACAR